MSSLQKEYTKILDELCGKDWKQDKKSAQGNAGVAVILSVLRDGDTKLQNLKKNLPDFSNSEIRGALRLLKLNNYFEKQKNGRYKVIIDSDCKTNESMVVWLSLAAGVANGWIKRAK